MQTRILCVIGGLFWLAAAPAHADIYKCIDPDGRVTYSNVADKRCKRIQLEPLSVSSSTSSAAPRAVARTPTPSSFPKVEEDAQKARDNDRRRILENELASEQQNLEQAKKDLAAQEAVREGNERNYQRVLDRLQPYKDKVALYERNIEAIESEIRRLR